MKSNTYTLFPFVRAQRPRKLIRLHRGLIFQHHDLVKIAQSSPFPECDDNENKKYQKFLFGFIILSSGLLVRSKVGLLFGRKSFDIL